MTLEPGDCLLFRPSGLLGLLVTLKTWHQIAHVEMYAGDGQYFAARAGGVHAYTDPWPDLAYMLRPRVPFDFDAAAVAFDRKWRGQAFDYFGLLRFAWWRRISVKPEDSQFCSELVTRLYRAGGLDPFHGEDADAIAPFQFLLADCFDVWAF